MEKFCNEEEFLKIVIDGDKEVFDEVLSRVFIKGVETALLYLPETVDKLGKKLAYTTKVFGKFLEEHPEFKEKKELVLTTIQQIEFQNPLKTMEEILELAVPKIEKEIKLLENMAFTRGEK